MIYLNGVVQANHELRFPNRNILDTGFRIVVKRVSWK